MDKKKVAKKIKVFKVLKKKLDVAIKRLPGVKTLYEMLPRGTEGGKEFARIVDLLLFHEARGTGDKFTIINDASGDYHGLDSYGGDYFRKHGTTGYQYKFYPSPLSSNHRSNIEKSLKRTAKDQKRLKLKKWILVTPEDLMESATRKGGGDVSWFENLRVKLGLKFELEHFGHTKLLGLFLQTPFMCLFYYPILIPDGATRKKTIQHVHSIYDENLRKLYQRIEFVGMSVYKPEATRGIPMEDIYIPLTSIPYGTEQTEQVMKRDNPLSFKKPGSQHVLLGDPGSGKSTLLRFLALAGISKPLQKRCNAKVDKRLPILVTLRRYADELKVRRNLSLIDYIVESIQADFNLKAADLDFFEYFLETGQGLLLFDGLDELPSPQYKRKIRNNILALITSYPGNTIVVTSRIVGYESYGQFDRKEFLHHKLTRLDLPEIEQFVSDWYRVRIENEKEREANVNDLIRILRDKEYVAIRDLAENPLLLTIVALVHRIDAVLPDERVVLYEKCTETLLNTWHTWKFRDLEVKHRGKVERRNRRRMEAIAYWMHCRGGGTKTHERAVVPYEDLKKFLADHIRKLEVGINGNKDAEDMSDDFLEFVKKRAGLLIEIGDRMYSFVHLTFQEYLASSCIISAGEKEGATKIWRTISNHCRDVRWNELIRLLVAGLKSDESQEFIIERMLEMSSKMKSTLHISPLGGLLLDGIEAAERHKKEIFEHLFRSSSESISFEQISATNSLLRTCLSKESDNILLMEAAFQSLWRKRRNANEKLSLILIGCSLKWGKTRIRKLTGDYLNAKNRIVALINLLLFNKTNLEDFSLLQKDITLFWAVQDLFSISSEHLNFVSACLQALTCSFAPKIRDKRVFEEYILHLGRGYLGPFHDFSLNMLLLSKDTGLSSFDLGKTQKAGMKIFDNISNISRSDIKEVGKIMLCLDPTLKKRFNLLKRMFEKSEREPAIDHNIIINNVKVQAKQGVNGFWQKQMLNTVFCNDLLDVLCNLFNLKPSTQWREALSASFLPYIPERINLFDIGTLDKLETAFKKRKQKTADVYSAAWRLMLDAWVHLLYPKSRVESVVGDIAELTRQVNKAPLLVAHCIRDLAYGNKDKIRELELMVNSDNSALHSIFEKGIWYKTAERIGGTIHELKTIKRQKGHLIR